MGRYVYLKNGPDLLQQRIFDCETKKLQIIDIWKKRYGKKFEGLTVEEEVREKKTKFKQDPE